MEVKRSTPTIGPPEQARADDNQNAAINSPLNLTGHHATRQNTNALQEPNNAGQDQQNADHVQNDFHFALHLVIGYYFDGTSRQNKTPASNIKAAPNRKNDAHSRLKIYCWVFLF
jgi:hypothetical protein